MMVRGRRMTTLCTLSLVILQLIALPSASVSWPWNDAAPQKIKPKITRPSGPTNVTLFVVSRTELGVKWDPPLFDGGRAISKYLVEWDTAPDMMSGIASPSNPYENNVDGPLVRSEVVWDETEFRITGLIEGQKYYVRVSAYGDGYSNAISANPSHATPSAMLPGYLTDVSLSIATDTDTADRLRLAWSAAKVDVNGFSVLPNGCAGGETPPASPDVIESYKVQWDTHPSFSNANTLDIPAITGDGIPSHCCPSGPIGACHVELGSEIQTVSIMHPASTVPANENLFDGGSLRIAYVGAQSKSIKIETPHHGSTEVRLSSPSDLPLSSPIKIGDLMRIHGDVYLVSSVANWPAYITLDSDYQAGTGQVSPTTQAYFSTPPTACFDLSDLGNSADSFRSHIAQNFDNSPFDESISVSRSTITESVGGSSDRRVVGYEYHVTFTGQGFSATSGHNVEDLIIISTPLSSFSSVGSCGDPFMSAGNDVTSQVSMQVSTKINSGSIRPGQRYYVQVAGVNSRGVGPFVTATPAYEVPKSLSGLAKNCKVYAASSSSFKVEWDGVLPYHGQQPTSYRVDFYDVDAASPMPVKSHLITEIDEDSQYSILVHDFTPGTRYRALVIPINDLGEGGPSWLANFDPSGLINDDSYSIVQDYAELSCNALPTCETTSVECSEIENSTFAITARSLPSPPSIEVGTYPNVSNKNRFSSDSSLVTFHSPLFDGNLHSIGVPTDKFRIEYATDTSFRDASTVEVPASYSDGDNENAFGEYLIDSLVMGRQYYVKVSAHNSAGYGSSSIVVPIKPMTRPDPPYEPILSSVSLDDVTSTQGLSENPIIGTSLFVSWQPPRVDSANGRPDFVGNGGDPVSSYLVEWSRISFDNYNPTIVEISITTSEGVGGSSAIGLLSGSFQLLIDTTISPETAIRGSYSSAAIPISSSVDEIKTIIENIPNVGEVNVYSPEPFIWILTFLSEVGDIDIAVAVNSIRDGASIAGKIDIVKLGSGKVPENAAYGFEIVDDIDDMTHSKSIHHTIQHLVPGMKLFTRVSASNQVGFGPRRKTAPEFISPALQRPEQPTSLYNDEVAPYLSIHSPTSLQVHIGSPTFDGGLPLTRYLIEWDLLPSFNSSILRDGSALGSARVDAASRICTSCVTGFDLPTNTFSYSGDADMAKLLIPQRKITVYFSDDNINYVFSIVSATSSTIAVSDKHLRVSSLAVMNSKSGGAFSDLDIVGAKYIINGLDSGRTYYVRVSSENGLGTGRSIGTVPHYETPRGFPPSPADVTVGVKDKNTLEVAWSNHSYANDPEIQAIKIEHFCKSFAASSDTYSFFGEQEVVEFSTVGLRLSGGTFVLYFGGLNSSSEYLGHVVATSGMNHVETLTDLTASLDRGEAILIGEEEHAVHPTEPFTSSRMPLSVSYSQTSSESVPVYARSKSVPVSFDASAEELQNALERMPNVNHVQVRRDISVGGDGHQWFVTFTSNAGPQPSFSIDPTFLVGNNPTAISATRVVEGVLPDCYSLALVDPATTTLELQDLVTGKPYYIRVASVSSAGESVPSESTPKFITPGGVPDPVSLPRLKSLNNHTLLVSFEAPSESNGAAISQFVVESSRDPSFAGSTRTEVLPDYKIQRVTTRAHTLPWKEGSSFTLSLGDFHGDFTVPIGSGTTARVTNGSNVLERSTGTSSFSSFVARGDYITVGGMEFRVCLDTVESTPHDDTRLSLCSLSNPYHPTPFTSDLASSDIDELPLFRLDTSLGAAMSPSLGDVYLSTVNASGSNLDTRGKLRRGDLVRVGHPVSGEIFRVSTDEARVFDDRVIPLGHFQHPDTPASLSLTSLQHSTYEVQSFYIRSNSESARLTPSNTLNSGYRVRFKSETSHQTTDAGSSGCLKWDGSAADLKSELESFSAIDSVEVTKLELPAVPGGIGEGVKYFITFIGDNVRGNVPPLQIVDVGMNGCLDATDLGGVFRDSLAPIVVEQVETPYIPFYEVQTTADIPYDASAEDMKAAIESLSQACSVTVSRASNRNGFSWDVTFVESKVDTQSPLLVISVNGENLAAQIDPQASVNGLQQVVVPTAVSGAPYFVRVSTVNSFGTSPFALSNPRALQASLQPPSAPEDLFIEPMSNSELRVQWNPPINNGGSSVTHYKVEYDGVSSFTSGANGSPFGSIYVSSSSEASIPDVQSITVKIDDGGAMNSLYLSGTFSLNYDGQSTGQLTYNASPEDVKHALESLCTVEEVAVTRSIHCSPDPSIGCMKPEGFTWLVTFVSVRGIGDQHRRATSSLSSSYSHKLSVDGSHLFECTDVDRLSCSIGGRAIATIGTTQEIQQVILGSSPFTITVGGVTSAMITLGESLSSMELKLNSIIKNGIGRIAITCVSCDEIAIDHGDSILLHFLSYRGDLPEITISDPTAIVSEVTKGSSQFRVGRSSYFATVVGLTSLNDWYVRVFAYNDVGEGPPAMAWPSPLRLSSVAPQAPQDVKVSIESSTSLAVSWDRPSSIGGIQLMSFTIEYDTTTSFSSQFGSPLGKVIVPTADADNSIGIITQSYADNNDPIMRKRIVIDDVSLISDGIIHVESELVVGGQHYVVTDINDQGCGVTCLTLDHDYTETTSSGMQIYHATNAKHYGASITNLVPGQAYFIRVGATNENASGPFAYSRNAFGPASSTPMDVPAAISWASMTTIDSDKLRLDFGSALNEAPEGVNGSPVSKYQVDIANAPPFSNEVISLSTQANDEVSGFMELSAGYQGNFDMLISLGNQPVSFTIVPGSQWVDTIGVDLRSVLHGGETIIINEERVTVEDVYSDGLVTREYHIKGTGDNPVFGYRMDTYIGSATFSSGDVNLIESNGRNMEPLIRPGEVIEIVDDAGVKVHLTVDAVSGSTVNFSPSYNGNMVTTAMLARKKVLVPANASSAQMKAALESLPDIGSVEVSREGPNQFEGYTWLIGFTSNTGTTNLLTSTESVSYISVSGAGQACDGHFVSQSFVNGRPSYVLLGKYCRVEYNDDNSQWTLFYRNSVLSSVSSTDTTAPTSEWTHGVTVALSDNTAVTLLSGQGSSADTSILQSSVDPTFASIIFSAEIEAGVPEVQEVVISSMKNDLRGSFELAMGSASTKVTVYPSDSVEDLTEKLQSLPEVGRVAIHATAPPNGYGIALNITFLSNSGDVPLLRHSGTSKLHGTGVTLNIQEAVKGTLGSHHIIVDNLESGQIYSGRIRAFNDHGYGPYTTTSQALGSGVLPLSRLVASPPGEPTISTGRVTKSQAEILFTAPTTNGSPISSYKFEWSTATSFDSFARAQVRVACGDDSEILGSFRFVYASDVPARAQMTVPIGIGSDIDTIKHVLDALSFIWDAEITRTKESASEYEWNITFSHDVGNTSILSVDSAGLRCQSEAQMVESLITMIPPGELPADYGSREVFTDIAPDLCGSMYLAESSSYQFLTFSATDKVSGGSYQLMLDDESTVCISVDATEEEMKTAIERLSHVKSVDVTRSASDTGFPYSYDISFIGNYAYGDWPALKVDTDSFGNGMCDAFVGGSSHKATFLPVRDETLCVNGTPRTVAIVADALSPLGGSFIVEFGTQHSPPIAFDTTSDEMAIILQVLTGVNGITVSKHNYQDFSVGVAWAVTFPRQTNDDNIFRVIDTHVTGKNSRVSIYPVLRLSLFSSENDSVGDFRVVLDGEPTAPLSHRATNNKLLRELHRHNCLGRVAMLGPQVSETSSPVTLDAIIDDTLIMNGLKAIRIPGDLTTTVTQGDEISVGSCIGNLRVSSIEYVEAGGESILTIDSAEDDLSFTSDCGQLDGPAEVSIGTVLLTEHGFDHSVIVKSNLCDIDTIRLKPESNWRGTEARLFFHPPSGMLPQTFILGDLDKSKTYIVRASARNNEGFSKPSNVLTVRPRATVPSAPISVSLDS